MEQIQFEITIAATKEQVWKTLWQDETFRDWAGIIDPQTYMVGELKQGSEIQFISAANGYGVTSWVEEFIPAQYLLLRHAADTQETGSQERDNQWTGGTESYTLTENNGSTILKIAMDVPTELEQEFRISYPKALERIKSLTEA